MTMQETERFDATDESGRTRVVIGDTTGNGQFTWHTEDGRALHKVSTETFEIIPTGEVLKVSADSAER